MNINHKKWPDWISATLHTLIARPERFALISPNEFSSTSIDVLKTENIRSASIGELLTSADTVVDEFTLVDQLNGVVLLTDLGILFDQQSPIDPLRFLRNLARSGPRIALWPGNVKSSQLEYGSITSCHRFVWKPENALILTPIERYYPDEIPFSENWIN